MYLEYCNYADMVLCAAACPQLTLRSPCHEPAPLPDLIQHELAPDLNAAWPNRTPLWKRRAQCHTMTHRLVRFSPGNVKKHPEAE